MFDDSVVSETPIESQEELYGSGLVRIVEERESAEEGIVGVEDDVMYDSIVPDTPMEESQNVGLVDVSKGFVKVKEDCEMGVDEIKRRLKEELGYGPLAIMKVKGEQFLKGVVDTQVKQEQGKKDEILVGVKEEIDDQMDVDEGKRRVKEELGYGSLAIVKVKEEPVESVVKVQVKQEQVRKDKVESVIDLQVKQEEDKMEKVEVKEEKKVGEKRKVSLDDVVDVEESNEARFKEYIRGGKSSAQNSNINKGKPVHGKKEAKVENKRKRPPGLKDGDYPEEPEWWLPLGDGIVSARSTARGRKLEMNELVDIKFPIIPWRSNIVRFETKRCGEIGTLPMDWAKCLTTLFINGYVKVYGRCIDDPGNLTYHQDIMLTLRCYVNKKIFTDNNHACWSVLPTLYRLMGVLPLKEAECTPEYVKYQKSKSSLSLQSRSEIASVAPPAPKRRKGGPGPQITEKTDEQSISEATLNKIVGAAEVYHLEEMEPPSTLSCVLRPYQKQALFWMCRLESKEDAAQALHPYYAEYQTLNGKALYVNTFSGEATMKMPTATDSARGGILADAMGLGKTVMTIALIHARLGRGIPGNDGYEPKTGSSRARGGTLIVCPMALLSQWKDELQTHSEADTLSVAVHYGSDRTNNPRAMANHDVVLTTYGVLNAAYKTHGQSSIYHKVDWHRVVLDEAHTIKAWKTQTAQAVFALPSHLRWCLTGTPLQNSLEDLYSLFCFLKVQPWCDWNNWRNTIQRPYESGDPTGLTYVKAILRPLMLRRTKETRDEEGRLILELPPIDIKTVLCEPSEAEYDFYDALFRRSKVQFDEFLAQGRVLHNYASVLELLLRLRQCCNHPFLVMSRSDSQLWDLQRLAKRFLESNTEPTSSTSRAYLEEVVEGIQQGDHIECPICLESADHPVVTPCGHKMCKECLLQSWRCPTSGSCPICRRTISKDELLMCPLDTRFQIDVEKNWKESSKVSKLLECLDSIRMSASTEKSIVFSQWTSFLDLLEIPLERRGIGFLRFDGSLSQKQREKVLKEFNESKEKTVMLMSLKAGGVGLNLTAASNAFLMDPWWNPAVEEQAIMRIHRIGQKQTVKVRRFIVKDTVEERLLEVQARKQNMIAGALTDDDVRSARLEDLKMLFR